MDQNKEEVTKTTAGKGKKLPLVISCIVAGVIVLGVGGFFLVSKVVIPTTKYNQAMALMNDGKYKEAEDLFYEIRDYRDSSDQMKMAQYNQAMDLISAGDYEEGYEILSSLGRFNDSNEQISISYYTRGDELYTAYLDSGDSSVLEEAAGYFEAAGNYEDSSARADECNNTIEYENAVQLLDSGDYLGAVNAFQSLGDFNDSEDRMYEAMYEYCDRNGSSSDTTTSNYITTLENNNYPGVSSLINSIYQVCANIDRVNNSAYDNTNNYSYHYEYEYVYYHVSVSGLRPGQSCTLEYEVEWGDGDTATGTWTNVVNGDDLVLEVAPYHVAPYETFRVFTSSGRLLDSITVDIY